jgi:ATP-dependent helicase/nuclease subunit A
MELLEEDKGGILSRFSRRFKHVLIDEFQDTDPRQWRLAELLWDGGKGCKLFVVGDPKQSIYGFRSADVRLFLKATGLVREHHEGNVVVLDRNFRSSSEVMDFVNTVFPRVMEGDVTSWSVPFDPLDSHRREGGSVSIVGVIGKQGAEAREGRMAAELITRAVRGWEIGDGEERRPVAFSDIAILLPTRKGFERYEDALRDARIPYQVYKGRGFFERQEVKDVHDMIRFLCDPNDDLSLAGILKGPFFSLSDEDMMNIESGQGSLWSRLSGTEGLSGIAILIEKFLGKVSTLPPWRLLEEIYESTGIHATAGGRRQYRNLDRLLEWIMLSCGDRDLWYVRDALMMMIEEPPTEGEPPVSRDDDCVTVLTVHSSKGLEWPVVFVLGLNHEGRGDQWSSHRIDPDNGITLKVLDTTTGELVKTPAWSAAGENNDIREMEERKRLFYVACTRARDHLILSGVIPVDRNGREREPRGLMKLLMEGTDLSLEDMEESSKRIGPVDVRLFPVKQGEEVVAEEEEEDNCEVLSRKGEAPLSCGIVNRGERRFYNPTGVEMVSELDLPGDDGSGTYIPDFTETPAPDERGEIVHRAMEGVPLKRLLREYGFSSDVVEKELSEIIRDLRDQISKIEGRKYKEIELVGFSADRGKGKLPLKGRLDLLIERDDGSFLVVDFKTGKDREEHTAQMEAYRDMLTERSDGRVETRILYPRVRTS